MSQYRPINLQYFAQEKTEKATPKKRQEQRKKGQVAKSAEVASALIMLCVFLALLFLGGWLGEILLGIFRHTIIEFVQWDFSETNIAKVFQELSLEAAKAVAPIMLVSMTAGVFANYIQVGFLVATDPLKMKLERIDPIKGFKRIFSARALVEFCKSIFKISLIAVVVFGILWSRRDDIMLLSQKSVGNALSYIGGLTVQIGLTVAVILIFIAMLDYLYQKYDFEKNIRMSKQDIKDEHKKSEGDPLIKSKIKERQRQMAMRRMMQEVPKADVIITNPTHYAIAIQYDQEEMEAPVVIAKGVDYLAFKIREVAGKHSIVTMENKPLARALYQQVEIGESVPEELYKAVAEVLAYVYRIKGKV
ncbi:flagellar biosynthesis protein FlhB [Bacillus horti]|uniref:Flagellar biosynthetic protein FlhB n=1 Tax=Caldalkalibacillus horti TaxID=77523 RepID=A0ABT9VUL8_9BACI|nr:flagellar biosynthesis protein FlhB [Bacillus horti]MDQ0164679.1 flagellar biosynthetic protein FlhB [Bacillus horti]